MFVYHDSADMAISKHTDMIGEGSVKGIMGHISVIADQKLVTRDQ
jgi:hypothetical protein